MVTLRLDEVKNSIKVVLSYVLLNILLTLSIWYFVYDAKYGIDVFYYNFLLDIEGSHFSTGDKFFDGIFNGLLIAAYIVILSFLLIACVLYKFKRVVVVFIHCSFLILSIVMPGTIFKDFFAKYFGLDNQLVVGAIVFATLLYASAATLSLFTDRFPPIFRQMFAITNCASVSVYYLRLLPRHTIWFLLLAVIFWDMFAVKSSFGPLKLAIQNSQDYSEGLLRFVTLTVQKGNNDDDDDASSLPSSSSLDSHHSFSVASASTSAELVQLEEEEEVESSNDEYEEAIITTTNNSGTQVKEERTAYDVLNDGNWTTLGTGDLIIYGLFVGKALESGSQLAVIAAIIGVLVGLILTLSISSDSDDDSLESDYVPALPLPLSIGMIVYFGALFAEKAFHQTALSGTAITL